MAETTHSRKTQLSMHSDDPAHSDRRVSTRGSGQQGGCNLNCSAHSERHTAHITICTKYHGMETHSTMHNSSGEVGEGGRPLGGVERLRWLLAEPPEKAFRLNYLSIHLGKMVAFECRR